MYQCFAIYPHILACPLFYLSNLVGYPLLGIRLACLPSYIRTIFARHLSGLLCDISASTSILCLSDVCPISICGLSGCPQYPVLYSVYCLFGCSRYPVPCLACCLYMVCWVLVYYLSVSRKVCYVSRHR